MQTLGSRAVTLVWVGLWLSIAFQDAEAYLDPGTGSMLLQGLIGGLAIAVAGLAQFRMRIVSFFTRLRRRPKRPTT